MKIPWCENCFMHCNVTFYRNLTFYCGDYIDASNGFKFLIIFDSLNILNKSFCKSSSFKI